MSDSLFPYQIKDDYYDDVNDFAEEFISFARELNVEDLSEMLEGLLIGVYWELYKNDAMVLSEKSHKILATLSNRRNESKKSKELIDDVRGMLLTKEFSKEKNGDDLELNKSNLKILLDYLEATGDFIYQLPYLKKYEQEITPEKLDLFQELATWFLQNSSKYLATYTLGFKEFFKNNEIYHNLKEDIIFFNSPEELYHLNMLGANLMNRIFRPDFQSRKRKVLLCFL